MNDCLYLLCEHLKISNPSENDEYSIFIISTSSKSFLSLKFNCFYSTTIEYSSRLLNPTEYLFDILNEYARSNIINYHFIIKRMLWIFYFISIRQSPFIGSIY